MNYLGANEEDGGCPGVALVPGRKYLESSPALNNLRLWLYTRLQMLICCRCQVALSLKMVMGHLKKQHNIIVPVVCKKELEDICVQNRVYKNLHEVPLLRVRGPLVEGITSSTTGLWNTSKVASTLGYLKRLLGPLGKWREGIEPALEGKLQVWQHNHT